MVQTKASKNLARQSTYWEVRSDVYNREAHNIISESKKKGCLREPKDLSLTIFWVTMDKYIIFVGFSLPPVSVPGLWL